MVETSRSSRQFGSERVEVALRRARPLQEAEGRYPPLAPATLISDGIRLDRDVAVPLRDGTIVYVDVYRPDGPRPVPVITAWSPFGKRCGEQGMALPRGVPDGTLSPAASFEAADPYYWCHYGYAVVNTDSRGIGHSEGDVEYWSSAEGRDAADVIDWIGEQAWCTGQVGLSGNSWLAITQWFAAAERPRHLACIAPWEGVSDLYRDLAVRGGIPEVGFTEFLIQRMFGPGYVDDVTAMAREHPFLDSYWQDKIAAVEKIEVPAYICAGWSQFFHLNGTLRAFRRIGDGRAWLRTHREFEWPDYYAPDNLRDLRLFFDRYLKGIRNGWELTPRVRIEVMDRGDQDRVSNRAERDFPLPGTEYTRCYLDGRTATLSAQAPSEVSSVSYDAVKGRTVFDLKFDQGTEITGYLVARLFVQAQGADDLDLFVTVQKLDPDGEVVPTLALGQPHPGAIGILRASHRELDPSLSTDFEPVQAHRREQLLADGEVVGVDISIWPTSRYWHPGETLRLVVAGHHILDEPGWDWFEHFIWATRNAGRHVLHTGGEHASYLQLPVIPANRPISLQPGFQRLTPAGAGEEARPDAVVTLEVEQ